MANVHDIYPSRYLSPADLPRPVTVTIVAAPVETLRNPRTQEKTSKVVLVFKGARKVLPLNKTQALSIAEFAGADTDKWPGVRVTLAPARAPNGQGTIAISEAHDNTQPPGLEPAEIAICEICGQPVTAHAIECPDAVR